MTRVLEVPWSMDKTVAVFWGSSMSVVRHKQTKQSQHNFRQPQKIPNFNVICSSCKITLTFVSQQQTCIRWEFERVMSSAIALRCSVSKERGECLWSQMIQPHTRWKCEECTVLSYSTCIKKWTRWEGSHFFEETEREDEWCEERSSCTFCAEVLNDKRWFIISALSDL